MDHKGPEHHYDEIECPECGSFFQQGELQPETVHNNCPECGYDLRSSTGGRPYRGQPSDINSEMTERNTPLDGSSKDRGGNPLQEGILANLKRDDEEDLEEIDEATEPKGLGETNPVKDHDWASGEITSRPARDEMLGSVRQSNDEEKSENELWDEVVNDFEHAKGGEIEDPTEKVAAASWLENDGQDSNIPVEHFGWDIVDVIEPSKEHIEAANKYSMPIPDGITDNLHEVLIKLNAWVENPEENGKLRPYKQYWSAIRPKIREGSIKIGVEDPHMADIINHIARTNDLSALKTSSVKKQAGPALALVPEGVAAALSGLGIGAGAAEAAGAAGLGAEALGAAEAAGLGAEAVGAGEAAAGAGGLGKVLDFAKGAMKKAFNPYATAAHMLLGGGDQGAGGGMPGSDLGAVMPASYYEGSYHASNFQLEADARYTPGAEPEMQQLPEGQVMMNKRIDLIGQPPVGFSAHPSGHGEAIGDRDLQGRMRPMEQRIPESDRFWKDPNIPNPPAEWELENPKEPPTTPPAAEPITEPEGVFEETPEDLEDKKNHRLIKYLMGFAPELAMQLTKDRKKDYSAPGAVKDFGYYAKTSTYGDEYEHPNSITRRVEDLENGGIDPHQRTDESNDDWGYDMLDVNEIGQSRNNRGLDDPRKVNASHESLTEDQINAIVKFLNFLPLIKEFAESDESAESDPIVMAVHQALDSAFPGYLEDEDEFIREGSSPGFDLGTGFDGQVTPIAPEPTVNNRKPNTIDPSTHGFDPQTGPANAAADTPGWIDQTSPNLVNNIQPLTPEEQQQAQALTNNQQQQYQQNQQNIMNQIQQKKQGSHEQGPHTDEQQKQFVEHIHEKLQNGELDKDSVEFLEAEMFENPSNSEVVKIWSEVTNDPLIFDTDPEDVQNDAQAQPMAPPGVPPGGMPPMLNEGMPPGMPPMGAPTPGDLNPAGPEAMQPPAMQLGASVIDSMLHAAFKYGSDNVAGKCPNCDGHTTKMVQQDGKSRCHSCGHQWKDETYEKADGDSSNSSTTASFYQSLNFDEGPETVMPSPVDTFSEPEEEIEVDDSSHTWTDESGEPLQEGKEYEIYAHNYEIPDVGRVKEIKPDAIVYEIESNGGLRTTIEIDRQEADLNGYTFAPTSNASDESNESTTFGIEDKIAPEPGQTTDLSTPHIQIGSSVKESISLTWTCPQPNCQFNAEGGDIEPGTCPYHDVPLEQASTESMRGIHKELSDQRMQDAAQADLRTFTHVAGKHYTPMEQRELIDEYGEARNADKLNLEGTHYADSDPDYFLFGC